MINHVKKHIVFAITRSDSVGGAQIHVRDLSLYCKEKGFKVTIISGEGNFFDPLKNQGINLIKLSFLNRSLNLIFDSFAVLKLNRIIKTIKPDILSTHSSKAGALIRISSLLSFKYPPIIFTAHGWSFATGKNFLSILIFSFIERFLAFSTEKLITVCETDLKLGLEYKICNPNKLLCIHNGMHYYPSIIKKKNSKFRNVRLISIARFQNQKDHFTLLKGLSKIRKTNWELTLIGDGPLKDKIISYAINLNILNKIKFISNTNDTKTYLDESDIYLLISNWEGFPRSIIEALRSSLPIIASNVGGVLESVVENHNGFLIEPLDYKKIASSIEKLSQNPKLFNNFSKNSRNLFDEKYQFIYMARKTLKLYYSIIDKSQKK